MVDLSWITTTGTTLLMVLLSGLAIYTALLILTRLTGLRSFSKMSGFDFAVTVATGSLVASTLLTKEPPLLTGMFGLIVLFGIQYTISKFRRFTSLDRLIDNTPLLLMAGEKVLSEHLDAARMTEEDLKSKLRMAGVTHPSQVLAVVFETTGDVSVLMASHEVDRWLFDGIRGADHL